MKFSQIAIYHPDTEEVRDNLKRTLGAETYVDRLKMFGVILGRPVRDVDLELTFTHDLLDSVEIEYITSESPYHWHRDRIVDRPDEPFLSHLGVYCTEDEFQGYYDLLCEAGAGILQLTTSYDHSHKREGDGDKSSRTYRDAIFDTEHFIGFNIKLSCKEK